MRESSSVSAIRLTTAFFRPAGTAGVIRAFSSSGESRRVVSKACNSARAISGRKGDDAEVTTSARALAYREATAERVIGDRAQIRVPGNSGRSEEHTSELQSLRHLVCRLL